MINYNNLFRVILIASVFLGLIFILIRRCERPDIVSIVRGNSDPSSIQPIIIRDTVWLDRTVIKTKYAPKYIEVIRTDTVYETIFDTHVVFIDTATIFNDYFISRLFTDTLPVLGDPLLNFGHIIITDLVSQNKIESRDVVWNFNIPTEYSAKITQPDPVTKVFIGLEGGFNKDNFISNISSNVILNTKGDRLYKVGIGVQNNSNTRQLDPFFEGGVYWKIKFKQR